MNNSVDKIDIERLPPWTGKAVDLLMSTPKLSDVAQELNLSRQSLWKWLNDPRFRLVLAQREAETLAAASRRLIELCVKSTETLDAALRGADVPPTALRAADITLKRAPILLESAMVHVKLAALEARLDMAESD